MRELWKRLWGQPVLGAELLLATFLITALSLANTLFVMLVFNRFIPYGVDATLVTLTAGVLVATALDSGLKLARRAIGTAIVQPPSLREGEAAFTALVRARMDQLDRLAPARRMEVVRGLSVVERTLSSDTLTALMDIPFSLLVVLVIAIIQPILAGVVLAFAAAAFVIAHVGRRALAEPTREANDIEPRVQSLLTSAAREADVVRAFNAGAFLHRAWKDARDRLTAVRRVISDRQGRTGNLLALLTSLLSVAVVTIGAVLVVKGVITMGALVGANMLASRALGPIVRLAQISESLTQADDALRRLRDLAGMGQEPRKGTAFNFYRGGVELADIAYAYPRSPAPLFEHLSLRLEPGRVLVVTGPNGSGKTTLARLLAGLVAPTRGQVFADGTELRQILPEWWRRQLVYLPQEPVLFDGTVADNIRMNAPAMEDSELARFSALAGLDQWLESTLDGTSTMIREGGRTLALGVRKRIALARALATEGNLAILDEPGEGMDRDGRAAVGRALDSLISRGASIVILTHEAEKVKGGHFLLDLGSKPVPSVTALTAPRPSEVANAG